MIINIRGTSGSGKSTIVRKLIQSAGSSFAVYGMLGPARAEAYLTGYGDQTYILGPYEIPTGGMDAVVGHGGIPACIELLDKYVDKGHLIFEGLIISSMWGSIGSWLERHKSKVIIAPISASWEECQAGLVERQGARAKGDKTQAIHFAGTKRVVERAAADGFRVEPLDRKEAVQTISRWLDE